MFSIILDLPPIVRNSFENIITHSLLEHSLPQLNNFMKTYMGHLKQILDNGIKDCSQCNLPHLENGYDYIINFIKSNPIKQDKLI